MELLAESAVGIVGGEMVAEAGRHYCGKGLAEGPPSFAGYAAAKRFLLKNEQQQAARKAIGILAGTTSNPIAYISKHSPPIK